MDNTLLRRLGPSDLAAHLRRQREELSEELVSEHLLRSIESGAIVPNTLSTWFKITQSPSLVDRCLRTEFSSTVRVIAIKSLGKQWRGKQWRSLWRSIGGAQGLLEHMAAMSVSEVKATVKGIGRVNPTDADASERRTTITELFQSLQPQTYMETQFKSIDTRNLIHQYRILIPACTSAFVENYIKSKKEVLASLSKSARHRFFVNHYDVIGKLVDETLFGGQKLVESPAQYVHAIIESGSLAVSPLSGLRGPVHYLLTLLQKFVDTSSDPPQNFSIFRDLLNPLLRRIHADDIKLEIITLAIRYLSIHSGVREKLVLGDDTSDPLIYAVVACWGKMGDKADGPLRSTLRMMKHGSNNKLVWRYHELLKQVPRQRRYTLLQLCFLHHPEKSLSLDWFEDLSKMADKQWPMQTFLDMDASNALGLLERLMDVLENDDFLSPPSNSIYFSCAHINAVAIPASCRKVAGDVLLCVLRRSTKDSIKKAQYLIDQRQNLASIAREQTIRGFEVRAALLTAIASGSIHILGEVLSWTKRFIRDPLTVKMVFNHSVLLSEEAVSTLSGLPFGSEGSVALHLDGRTLELADVQANITKANEVLTQLLDIATSAISEPSFYVRDWEAVKATFEYVTWTRVTQSGSLKNILGLTDEELYESLFKSTLEVLLKAEKIGLESAHASVGFNGAFGPACVGYRYERPQPLGTVPVVVYKFIDELAKARDALWREHRTTIEPGVVTLPRPWPRGLPLQCLYQPFDIAVAEASGFTPYIMNRAKSIAFADASEMMAIAPGDEEKDEEIKKAVGSFVDGYGIALKLYVYQAPSSHARLERCAAVLNHALLHFRLNHIPKYDNATLENTTAARFRLFGNYIQDFLPIELISAALRIPRNDLHHTSSSYDYPLLPVDVDPNFQDEWNPDELKPRDEKAFSSREALNLDYFLETGTRFDVYYRSNMFQILPTPKMSTRGISFPSVFNSRGGREKNHLVRDAQVATSLLYLDAVGKRSSRILTSAFPSSDDPRFPPLFLSLDFLGKIDQHHSALSLLEQPFHLKVVPPSLLVQLISSKWSQYVEMSESDEGYVLCERVVYQLLRLLTLSDSPHLASGMVLRAVIDRPNASSWHRLLVSLRFLHRMPASKVRDFMTSFANEIKQKLNEQSNAISVALSTIEDPAQQAPKPPVIKVTTVKYLAQLLSNSTFIAPEFSLELLGDLFRDARHIDIRAAIIESLLDMLGDSTTDVKRPFAERILRLLERTVPIAASLNERKPLTEQEWCEAEKGLKMPAVWSEGQRFDINLPPVLGSLINFEPPNSWLVEAYMSRILVPILKQSCANNARWLHIFAAKSGYRAFTELPALPVKPGIIRKILSKQGPKPFSLVQCLHDFVMLNVQPPPPLLSDLSKLKADDLRKSPAGQHALSLVDKKLGALEVDDFLVPTLLFSKPAYFSDLDEDTAFKRLQAMALLEGQSIIRNHASIDLRAWIMFTHNFYNQFGIIQDTPSGQGYRSVRSSWDDEELRVISTYGVPWTESLLGTIDDIRSNEDWKTDPNRTPFILPDILALRIHTRVAKCLRDPKKTQRDMRQEFACVVAQLVDLFVHHPSYWDKHPLLQAAAKSIEYQDWAYTAHAIATHDPSRDTAIPQNLIRKPTASEPFSAKRTAPNINNPDRALYMRIDIAHALLQNCKSSREDADVYLVADLLRAWKGSVDERVRMTALKLVNAWRRQDERDSFTAKVRREIQDAA